jgi:5-formyltetrahydrofolate cyclo-ligase
MSDLLAESQQQKNRLRRQAYALRNAQANKDHASRIICKTVLALPEYQSARTILWYMHCRSEVRTLALCADILADQSKTIVIPYCTVDQNNNPLLGLWKLDHLNELEPGMWNIPEPPRHRWADTSKQFSARHLDLVIVPGVGFDPRGGRLGNGKGYYDRLLAKLNDNTVMIGVGYQSQVFDAVPMTRYDVFMHKLVTEQNDYQCFC